MNGSSPHAFIGGSVATLAANGLGDLQGQLAGVLQEAGINKELSQSLAGLASATGAAAIGNAVGGTNAAAAAFNTDANNRQLHKTEIQLIEDHAVDFAKQISEQEGREVSPEEAGKLLTQAFLSKADAAWDATYQDQNVTISTQALAYIEQLKQTNIPVNGVAAFTVSESDRENRFINANTVLEDTNFYVNNAATDQGRQLISETQEGQIYSNKDYRAGEQQGYLDKSTEVRTATNQVISDTLENPISFVTSALTTVTTLLTEPEKIVEGIIASQQAEDQKQTEFAAGVVLETLEGQTENVGYLQGANQAEENSDAATGIALILTGGTVAATVGKKATGVQSAVPEAIPPKKSGSVQELEVDGYKDLKKREVVGDNLEHDHIPSSAALIKSVENQLGRRLTNAERRQVHNQGTAVEVSKDIHKDSRTFRGRNTSEQVKNDADDLVTAACKDCDVFRDNAQTQGKDLNEVDKAIKQLHERNIREGVYTREQLEQTLKANK